MKGLYKKLPPFTPDYSGVCSVLFELGGILVIHDAGGCTGNFTGYDEPRWYGSSSAIYSSELREVEAVLGDDEKLLDKLESAVRAVEGGRFVAIIGSPAPMVIGTDYRALACLLARKTGLPVLAFDTNGIGLYHRGASMAFLELARRFVKPASTVVPNGVNIIGATPLDLGKTAQIEKLVSLLTAAGCRVISCWAMGATLDDIGRSAQARLNVVVSQAGLGAARHMECTYGLPFLAGLPIGCESGSSFVQAVRLRLGLDGKAGVVRPKKAGKPAAGVRSALVIGEQVRSNSIRRCLQTDLGIDEVTVASFFELDDAIREEGDRYLEFEDALTALTAEKRYDAIIGDPLYRDLVPPYWTGRFIDLPHVALSGRLHWDRDVDLIGTEGLTLLARGLFEPKSPRFG